MPMIAGMDSVDVQLRNVTYREFIRLGRAPTVAEIARAAGATPFDVRAGWRRLHDDHAIVLDDAGELRMANPFSAVPTPFRVDAGGRSWFANCGWDALGIGAALGIDSVIHTDCADCHEPLSLSVREGVTDATDLVFHVLVPARDWWQDIGFT